MGKTVLLAFLWLCSLWTGVVAQVRLLEVHPTNNSFVLKNFGGASQDISPYVISSLTEHAAVSSLTGYSSPLAAGASVLLGGFALNDAAADVVLFVDNTDFANANKVLDAMQYGSASQGNISLAVTASKWDNAVQFVSGTVPYGFHGSGSQYGSTFWRTLTPTVTSVVPAMGSNTGGTVLTIYGTNFGSAGSVWAITVAGVPCGSITQTSHTQVGCTTNSAAPSGPSGQVVVSLLGQYNSTDDINFTYLCPAGSSQLSGACIACPNGYFSTTEGASNCTACPPGFSCTTTASTQCAAGSFAAGAATACTECSLGSYAPAPGSSSCAVCPAGSNCTTVGKTPCLAGTYSTAGQGICASCSDGQYAPAGASNCTLCPPGKECSLTAVTGTCSAGFGSDLGESTCSECTLGRYAPGTGFGACAACPAGSNCTTFSSTPCSAGEYSISGQAICTPCTPGQFSSAGASNCTLCPGGSACSLTAITGACTAGFASGLGESTCAECTLGRYAPGTGFASCPECPGGSNCTTFSATPCNAGEYSISGQAVCVSCAAGLFSPAGASNCTLCPAGSACSLTSASVCPQGSFSLAGATSCSECSLGTYAPGTGLSTCAACPAGSNCTTFGATPCDAGTYSISGQAICTSCSPGRFAPAGSSNCTVCPAGSSCTLTSASVCLPGSYSIESMTSCTDCVLGTYAASSGLSSCTTCPAGYNCTTFSSPIQCAPGTVSVAGQGTCISCTTGSYAPAPGSSTCIDCPAGSSCTLSAATTCLPGTFSQGSATVCTTCSAGTYAPSAGATTCQQCPAGFNCTLEAATLCAGGFVSAGGSSECTPCAHGTYLPAGSTGPCVPCPTGTYNLINGSSDCLTCPAGSVCTATSISTCPAGTFSTGFAASCTSCPAGTFSASGASSCNFCPEGHYCPSTSGSAIPCVQGYYSPGGAVTNCTICPAGTQVAAGNRFCEGCPAGFSCADSTASPVPCPATTYSAGGTVTACTTCPAGFACPTQSTPPTPCDEGTWSPAANDTCLTCPAGSSCHDPTKPPVSCETGYYSLAGQHRCIECPAGFSCATTTASPVACTAGTYALARSTSCSTCPAGSFCLSTSLAPDRCPVGYYSGAGNITCFLCPAGHDCASSSSDPVQCTAGSYSAVGASACSTCPAGFYCPSKSALPIRCSPGTYSLGRATECNTCPAGFYCPAIDAVAVHPCRPGSYSRPNSTSCTPCPAGSYCTDATDATAVYACPSGTFSTGGVDHCSACPAGWQCPSVDGTRNMQCWVGSYALENSTKCTSCPAGSACPFTTQDLVTACPSGFYAVGNGTKCRECPAGYFCANTFDHPVPCGPGTFSLAGSVSCSTCPAGFRCSRMDGGENMACPEGTYSLAGAVVCTSCPAGFSCAATNSTPVACADGTYSRIGQIQCTACPPGHQCTDKTTPTLCVAGTYSPGGQLSCSPCQNGVLCPAGSEVFAPTGASCPLGSYCPDSTTQVQCAAGTYGPTAGLNSSAQCVSCPAGFYCVIGTGGPIGETLSCPRGYYCPQGTSAATQFPCPAGTFNPQLGATNATFCELCPAGSYCPSASTHSNFSCPMGYYCEQGTMNVCFPGATGCDSKPPVACPAGTYSGDITGLSTSGDCQSCPAGSYCPSGSVQPTLCPPGTFGTVTNGGAVGSCTPCTAGRACPVYGLTAASEPCAPGHFCPAGTVFANDNPCPAGTFSNASDASSSSECFECPAGSACGVGTGGIGAAPVACAAGYFCPAGTDIPTRNPCPAGTYSNETNLRSAADCITCPAGQYCVGGLTIISGSCRAGYYCPSGSFMDNPYACPPGTYSSSTNLTSVDGCIACPVGHYCPSSASTVPIVCPTGTYGNRTHVGHSSYPTCVTCPAGHKCIAGQVQPEECGRGLYSPAGQSTCTQCPVGYYCANNATTQLQQQSSPCPAGLYCPAGLGAVPTFANHSCPVGQYCVQSTSAPQNCPSGTYNPYIGARSLANCTACPAGSYCLGGASNVTGVCSAGYYCPLNSSSPTQMPCPNKTYRALPAGESLSSCSTCPSGSYCPSLALVTPLPCPVGQFCVTGVDNPEPCPRGTFNNQTGLRDANSCTKCTPGYYCETTGLVEPTGQCNAGFFCSLGASTPSPLIVGEGGGVCPAGGFCQAGSSISASCPAGKFNNVTGAQSASDCQDCPVGQYCAGSNLAIPTGDCLAGYYCTGGASTPTQTAASPGFFTLGKAHKQEPCPPGTYNQESAKSSCLSCPSGFFCLNESTINFAQCPQGFYCPQGTSSPFKCPAGTFGGSGSLRNVSECTTCPPAQYCPVQGATAPAGSCFGGYYCTLGATSAKPVDGITGNICPAGKFCVNGTHTPDDCPAGTYSSATGLTAQSECLPCTGGHYCNSTGLSAPTGTCAAGFYCTSRATEARPQSGSTGGPCPTAHFCPSGSTTPQGCAPGTFMNITGQSSCFTCPPGRRCLANSTGHLPCLQGAYCPEGTNVTAPLCPPGTFTNRTDLWTVSQCTACTGGSYCATYGLSAPTGICAASYLCPSGAISPTGVTVASSAPNLCPVGQYCPAGSAVSIPCPLGTFSANLQNNASSDCQGCPAGFFCNVTGLSAPSGQCAAGYICRGSAQSATPPGDFTGGLCPVGHYCPKGTPTPLGCPAGTFNNLTGQSACFPCTAGYSCVANSTTFEFQPCPMGHYCPASTQFSTQFPCPVGTFSNITRLQKVSDCTACPSGQFCATPGLVNPTGSCSAGYFCSGSTNVSQPAGVSTGGICPLGSYCPQGSSAPILCEPGKYCGQTGLSSPSGDCNAGYYCIRGAKTPNATDGVTGNICPPGHYCLSGVSTPARCPIGTFSPTTGNVNVTGCQACTAGSYCNDTALTSVQGDCFASFYCPTGTIVPTLNCPTGHRCGSARATPEPCPAGTFQNQTKQTSCTNCPAGYYCEGLANTRFVACPVGAYCPSNTEFAFQHRCPNGTFGNTTHLTSVSQCHPCTPGSYCLNPINTQPTGLCHAGFFCTLGAASPTPTDGVTGNICPAGRYCPEGSITPIACAAGTFATGTGQTNVTACTSCAATLFCAFSGASSVSENETKCDAGYVCLGGSITPRPNDGVTGFQCGPGTFCTRGAVAPQNCSAGTYNPNSGAGACLACPVGEFCPDVGMTTTYDCPRGFYCPEGTSVPKPCPAGTFSSLLRLTNVSSCLPCEQGKFCHTTNLTEPTGLCSGGYFCAPGSATATPVGVFPNSGLCPPGRYCPAGTLSPINCSAGTYNPSFGADALGDCIWCTPGQYCGSEGLSTPSGPCHGGFYCPGNATAPNQLPCPKGFFCGNSTGFPVGCPDATYQPQTQQTSCLTCPAGTYCNSNASTPVDCPVGSYCPESSAFPTLCPNGTYGAVTRLVNASQCALCPAGKYCRDGVITGNCTAGFICLSGQSRPDPPLFDVSTGGPCPAGRYCPEGIELPLPCLNGTVRENTGGTQASDCGPCPAGRVCVSGDAIPHLCPSGSYCPFASTPIACRLGTYNPIAGAANESACLPCPAGFWCNATGLSSFSLSPCPVGQFCASAILAPALCPPGSYRDSVGAGNFTDCITCPARHFCVGGSTAPFSCGPAVYCPAGVGTPLPCPGGSYCPGATETPIACPGGHFCPTNSSTFLPCSNGYYCPPGSSQQFLCDFGTFFNEAHGVQDAANSTCLSCPPGTYGTHPQRASCNNCTAGFICLGRTTSATPLNATTERGTECPVGHYCPMGSFRAIACPTGHYNGFTRKTSLADCLPCPAGSFNSLTGQAACRPCGSSAFSGVASTTCACNGTHRVYQDSDGSCLCAPGYEFYDETQTRYDGDSLKDCVPIVYKRCGTGELRNSEGDCVPATAASCASACSGSEAGGSGGGSLNADLGICECANAPAVDLVCNTTCQQSAPIVSFSNGRFTVTDPGSSTLTTLAPADIDGFFGSVHCDFAAGCELLSVVCDSSGHTGVYGVAPSVAGSAVASAQTVFVSKLPPKQELLAQESGRVWPGTSVRRKRGGTMSSISSYFNVMGSDVDVAGMRLESSGGNGRRALKPLANIIDPSLKSRGYNNPTLCLREGEGTLFDLSAGPTHYPVYLKDNILNTNDDFDFGDFRRLAQRINANGSTINVFGFTFDKAGTYVFADNANRDKLTVISVLPRAQSCPTEGKIVASSATNLVALGVSQRSSLQLEPDLIIIAITLAAFIGVAIVIGGYTKFKAQRNSHLKGAEAVKSGGASEDEFKKLFRRLEEHRNYQLAAFKRQRKDFRSQVDRVTAETEQLKALLAIKTGKDGGNRAFVEAAYQMVMDEVAARSSYGKRQVAREEELEAALHNLREVHNEAIASMKAAMSADTAEDAELGEHQAHDSLQAVVEHVGEVTALIEAMDEKMNKEKDRRRVFTTSPKTSIVGQTVVSELMAMDVKEAEAESVYLDALKKFQSSFIDSQATLADTQEAYLRQQEEAPEEFLNNRDQVKERFMRNCTSQVEEIGRQTKRLLSLLTDSHGPREKLATVRTKAKEHQDTAKEIVKHNVERTKAADTRGLFRGVSPELAHALRVYLADQAKDLKVVRSGDGAEDDVLFLGDDVGASDLSVKKGSGGLEEALDEIKDEAANDAEEERIELLAEMAARTDVKAEDIRRRDRDLQKRNAVINEVLDEEHKRIEEERAELEDDEIDPNDKALLTEAQARLHELKAEQEKKEREMETKLLEEEQKKMDEYLQQKAELESAEREMQDQRSKMDQALEEKMEEVKSQEERTGILKEHQVQVRKLEDNLNIARQRDAEQLKKMRAEIRQKRARHRKALKKKHKLELQKKREEVQKLRKQVEEKVAAKQENIGGLQELAALAQGTGKRVKSIEEEAMEREHLRLRQELEKEHEDNVRVMEEQLAAQEQAALNEFEQAAAAQVANEREAMRQKQAIEREQRSSNKEEAAELLAKHDAELADFSRQLDLDKARQRENLEMQLAARRRHRERELKREHQARMKQEIQAQRKETEDVVAHVIKDKEYELLKTLLTPETRQKAKNTIERVMRPRHRKEKADLLKAEWEQVAQEVQDRLSEEFDRIQEERDRITADHNNNVIDDAEYEDRMDELDNTELDPQEVREQIVNQLLPEQRQRRAELREKQFEEVKTMFARFYDNEDFTAAQWQLQKMDLKAILAAHKDKQAEEERKVAEKLQELQQKEEEFKRQKAEELEEAMKEFEAKMERERQLAQEAFERQLEEKRAKEKEEKAKNMQERLQSVATDQREEILKEHEANLKRQEEMEEANLAQQRKKLEAQFKARKERLRQRELRKKQKEAQRAIEEERKAKQAALEELERKKKERAARRDAVYKDAVSRFLGGGQRRGRVKAKVQEAAQRFKKLAGGHRPGKSSAAKASSGGGGGGGGGLARSVSGILSGIGGAAATGAAGSGFGRSSIQPQIGGGDAAATSLAALADQSSPFFKKLVDIERSLQDMMQAEAAAQHLSHDEAMRRADGLIEFYNDKELFVDNKEKEFVCLPVDSEPELVDSTELPASVFVVYRFGVYILNTLQESEQLKGHGRGKGPLRLLLAKNVPAKGARFPRHNVFAKSFHFDETTNTVYIRVERASEVGELTLVLVHVLSHIRAGHWGDTHPKFLRQFYAALRVCFGELFFARAKSASSSAPTSSGGLGWTELQQLYGIVGLPVAREELIDEFIDLSTAGSDVDIHFSHDELEARLRTYKAYVNSSELREELSKVEQEMVERQDLTVRLANVEESAERKISPKDVVPQRIHALEDRADSINKELVNVVGTVRELKTNTLRLKKEHDRDHPAVRDAEEKLKHAHTKQRKLADRLAGVERRLADYRRELLNPHGT